jgi:hypothetical protein
LQWVQNSVLIEIPRRIEMKAANDLMVLSFVPPGCDEHHEWL